MARAVGVAVGCRSGGRQATTLVATISAFFFFFPFFPRYFSPSRPFLIKGVLRSQNLFYKSVRALSRHRWPFWGPLTAIFDFAGIAGGERMPPAPLGRHFYIYNIVYELHLEVLHSA